MSGRRFDSRRGRDKYDNVTSNRLKHLPPMPIQEVEVFDWDAKVRVAIPMQFKFQNIFSSCSYV